MRNYYIDCAGQKKGPYTLKELRSMWQRGAIRGRNLYCEEGGDKWKKLELMQSVLETGDTKPGDAAREVKSKSWWRVQFEKLRGVFKG